MSPLLQKDTNTSRIFAKYVRDGDRIAFGSDQHWMIARDNQLGEAVNDPLDKVTRRLVDDAGTVSGENDILIFFGHSFSCRLRDPSKAKIDTKRVAEEITGKRIRLDM